MRARLLLGWLLIAAPAFAGKTGAPRRLAEVGWFAKLTGLSIHTERLPTAEGGPVHRADFYRRGPDRAFTLRSTLVMGTDKNGGRFLNHRVYVPVEGRAPYRFAAAPRNRGEHRVKFDRPSAAGSTAGEAGKLAARLREVVDEINYAARGVLLGTATAIKRADVMFQNTTRRDGSKSSRERYGFRDATVELLDDRRMVEQPFRVVK
jgi:hypothetical protein